jgi:hypothetical protein
MKWMYALSLAAVIGLGPALVDAGGGAPSGSSSGTPGTPSGGAAAPGTPGTPSGGGTPGTPGSPSGGDTGGVAADSGSAGCCGDVTDQGVGTAEAGASSLPSASPATDPAWRGVSRDRLCFGVYAPTGGSPCR